ncbi:hypothetical protein [Dokdonella soli]|uniref:DUF3618 domain-containing protein n=1 Tax=Dokdonella soli TaxID=529810 RepID=A0ABP3U3J4_9GAMM
MTATLSFLRPAAVEQHVRRVARRMGCDADTIRQSVQRAKSAMRAGESAHRAIVAGIEVAAASLATERRRAPEFVSPPAVTPGIGASIALFAIVLLLSGIAYLTR